MRNTRLLNELKRFLPLLAMVIGLVIIFKPWLNALKYDNMQTRIINTWQKQVYSESPQTAEASRTWTTATAVISDTSIDAVWEENISPDVNYDYIVANVDGIIIIEKIKLKAPVIGKMTINNLDISICSVVFERSMGKAGNYVLAGHNSKIYGRHFNRLDELELGDIIILEDENGTYQYEVYDTCIVDPTDISVLYDVGDRKLLTMITCDNSLYATGRLIIKAELMEDID